jgi:hypothetical protein
MSNEKHTTDDEPLHTVAVTGPTEAQMIEEVLRNNGIACSLQGNVTANPLPATSDLDEVRVLVNHSDAATAEQLIAAYFNAADTEQ